jgi:hypothetical protein
MRIAFVGQARYFLAASLEGKYNGVEGRFYDLDPLFLDTNQLVNTLVEFAPDFIVFFRPDFYSEVSNILYDLNIAPLIGFLTEPVGTKSMIRVDNLRERRAQLQKNLASLRIDFIICFTNDLADFVSAIRPVTFVMPLPVNDIFYTGIKVSQKFEKPVFIGRLNDYRSKILNTIKHRHDPLIIDNGFTYSSFSNFAPDDGVIAINIHVGRMKTFEHRVLLHMAMSHLVISQPLVPSFGLLPNCEYLVFETGMELESQLVNVRDNPDLASWIAARGHEMAERHRASIVWVQLAKSLLILGPMSSRSRNNK